MKTYVLSGDRVLSASLDPDVTEIIASQVSPSGRYLAILREVHDANATGEKKRFVEVWSGDKIQGSQEVTQIHDEFYTDGTTSLSSIDRQNH